MIDRYSRPAMKRVWSDKTKYDIWLKVEVAVCEAWAELGAIPRSAMPGIRKASYSLAEIEEAFAETKHDVTAFLRSVQKSVGPDSRFIHMGLTSSDILDNALNLHLLQAIDILEEDLDILTKVVTKRAIEHKHTLVMARTHGVHAEPTTFGMKLLVWVEELKRNAERLKEARRQIAVGKVSGAVGSHATVPPRVEELACKRLGLAVAPASTQIIQRDRYAHLISTIAIIGASLEKFATEVRALQRTELHEVEEPFSEGQTGSSAMPHKRNPELSERVCGLARLLRGHSVTSLENVALWHERDISHSSAERIIIPDSCYALDYMLDLFTFIMKGLRTFPERMQKNLEAGKGLVFSQRVLLALIEKGMTRQDAYKVVQKNAMATWESEKSFKDMLRADRIIAKQLPGKALDALFDYCYYTKHVDEVFKRVGL